MESYLEALMYDVTAGEMVVKKAFANQLEKEKYEKLKLEKKMNEYNLRVITQSELLNHNYYIFPGDQMHPEICYVRLKLCGDARF